MSRNEYIWEDLDRSEPDAGAAEQMLKRLEAKALAEESKSFKEALGNRVWRTRDGRYIDFDKMDNNHLMNSYNLVERNIINYLAAAGYDEEEKNTIMSDMLHKKLDDIPPVVKKALGDQMMGYRFLYAEIIGRNLFQVKLEKAADDVFDVFDDIINSKPDDNET